MLTCPDKKRLHAYLNEQLSLQDSDFIEEHVEQCEGCEATIHQMLARESAPLWATMRLDKEVDSSSEMPSLDRYACEGLIDKGGFGFVWRAVDRQFNRIVAMKVMKARDAGEPSRVRRFFSEAQICSQLSHPYIVPIHDMGTLRDGRGYYTMRLVEGVRLDETFVGSRADVVPRVQIFEKICQAVAYAHEQGVIHRDLKPQNVMVGAHGEVQVMDWGLAKVLQQPLPEPEPEPSDSPRYVVQTSRHQVDRTASGAVGTFAYMPPEQAKDGRLATKQSDVFSLGAILYELLTGQRIYALNSASVMNEAEATTQIDRAIRQIYELPVEEGLRKLAAECINANPGNRPKDAVELVDRLQAELASIERKLEEQRLESERQRVRVIEQQRRTRLRAALWASLALIAVVIAGVSYGRQLQWQQRAFECRQLLDDVEIAIDSGEFMRARQQLELAREFAPEIDSDKQKQLQSQLTLCERFRDIFESHSIAHNVEWHGQTLLEFAPTTDQDALEQYAILLGEPSSATLRYRNTAAAKFVATAMVAQAWLRFRLLDGVVNESAHAEIVKLLSNAAEIDPLLAKHPELLEPSLWKQGDDLLERIDFVRNGSSPATTFLAGELALEAEVLSETAERLFAENSDEFWLNLRWGTELVERDEDDAFRFCQSAVALQPGNAVARLNLGTLHANRRQHEAAIHQFRLALKQDSENAIIHNRLGVSLEMTERFQEAIQHYQRAIECSKIQGFNLPEVNWALLLAGQGEHQAAEEKFSEAIRKNAESPIANYRYGKYLDEQGRIEEAIALYEKAIEFAPEFSEAHNNMGKSLVTQAMQVRQSGDVAESNKIVQRAQDLFRRATELDEENVWAWVNMGNTYGDQRNIDEAVNCFRRALQIDPDHKPARFNLANTLLNARNYEESVFHAKTLLRTDDENPLAHFLYALGLGHVGRFSESAQELKIAIEIAEDSGRPMSGPAEVLEDIEPLIELEQGIAESISEALSDRDKLDLSQFFYRKQMFQIAFSILDSGLKSDDELDGNGGLQMRASRYGVLAAMASSDGQQRAKYLLSAAQWFAAGLDSMEAEIESAEDSENTPEDRRRAILDQELNPVRGENLEQHSEGVQVAWKENWRRADQFLNH